MTRINELKRGHAARGGIVAGLVGGIVIAVVLLVAALARGQDIWPNFKIAAAPFLGERATQPGFDLAAVLLGVSAHMVVSIVWGLLFAVMFYGLSKRATLAVGAIYGVVVGVVMLYVVMPIIGLGASKAPIGMALLEHAIFGLAVAVGFLPFQREKMHLLRR